eukprot:1326196-Prymnesium_polylepis.1
MNFSARMCARQPGWRAGVRGAGWIARSPSPVKAKWKSSSSLLVRRWKALASQPRRQTSPRRCRTGSWTGRKPHTLTRIR